MTTLISQLTVLVMVGLIAAAVLALFGVLPLKAGQEEKEDLFFRDEEEKTQKLHTQMMVFWCMEQLDSAGNVLKRFDICEVPDTGLSIGSASSCDIVLEGSKYMGRHQATIGKDEKGLFLLDHNSKNGMYNERKERVKQLDIEDNVRAYLANVQVRFRIVDPFIPEAETEEENSESLIFKTRIRRL